MYPTGEQLPGKPVQQAAESLYSAGQAAKFIEEEQIPKEALLSFMLNVEKHSRALQLVEDLVKFNESLKQPSGVEDQLLFFVSSGQITKENARQIISNLYNNFGRLLVDSMRNLRDYLRDDPGFLQECLRVKLDPDDTVENVNINILGNTRIEDKDYPIRLLDELSYEEVQGLVDAGVVTPRSPLEPDKQYIIRQTPLILIVTTSQKKVFKKVLSPGEIISRPEGF